MKAKAIITAALLLLAQTQSKAQSYGLGMFNSYKGFGFQYLADKSPNEFRTYTLYADFACMMNSKDTNPGVKMTVQHNRIFLRQEFTNSQLNFFYSTGLGLGYCTDNLFSVIVQNYGLTLSAAVGAGVQLILPYNFDLHFCFNLEAGTQYRKNETNGAPTLSWYANGITRTAFPELIIYYRF